MFNPSFTIDQGLTGTSQAEKAWIPPYSHKPYK